MKDILDYFEDLDEAVYISDMMTHDLIYMNASLRKHFDYQSHEEYSGKKCYEVLHGLSAPCPFCNKDQLKEKDWVSWIYTSPERGKQFLVKDRLFPYEGKQYRIEVSLDIEAAASDGNKHYNAIYDSIVNECLQEMISTTSAEESIEQILAYVGTKFLCDRVYIFELQGNEFVNNTYEWCAEGCTPQKEILQNEPIESVDWWLEKFKQQDVVLIEDVEEIKTEYPATYAALKPQEISSLAAVPIYINGEVYGFFGVDNPKQSMRDLIRPLLSILEKIIPLLIRRRNLFSQLEQLRFRDPLTGAFNRHAMMEHFEDISSMKSIGIIYFDITGLKRTNDTLGHEAGDFMIQKCYEYLRHLLKDDQIYRIDGDEFLYVHPNCNEVSFYKQVEYLKEHIQTYQYHVAIGSVWSNQQPLAFAGLIAKADEQMYQDKRKYYAQKHLLREDDFNKYAVPCELELVDSPEQFMMGITHDTKAFFCSIAENNGSSYFYFGDIQKDLYYISDNLRDDFGFNSNIVPSFLQVWGKFIAAPSQKIYLENINRMMQRECSTLDFRYLVRDASGRALWAHNYAVTAWDEENDFPTFISGRITHQDNNFVVDSVTNFPRDTVFWNALDEMKEFNEQCKVIGFCFNHITEINNIYGRKFVDRMINDIAAQLLERLSDKIYFYRSEGIRCIAVVRPEYCKEQEMLICHIREIVKDSYERLGLYFATPCSFAVLKYSRSEMTVDEFRNNLEALVKAAKHTPTKEYLGDSAICPQEMKKFSAMELALNENVLHGMENFRIVVQPAVSAENGTVKGGEVLLRWKYQGNDVSPAVFIPLLEKSHMIHIAGRWVFDQTARTCSRIVSYYPDFYLSFNVSLYQLNDTGFTEFMQKTLNKYHIDGSHLVLELTESSLDKEPEVLRMFIEACKKIGLRLAMDDFGSGYSSLRMLLQYPYDIIKLDRSLLHEITVSEQSQSFVRSIVYTCRYCNKQVCVEGVETEEENAIIKETECDTIQGYYYHKPLELTQLYGLMNRDES